LQANAACANEARSGVSLDQLEADVNLGMREYPIVIFYRAELDVVLDVRKEEQIRN
jgi:hypothetical protein